MHADLLDLALLVLAAAFAVSGYRQGFIVGSLSFAGFLGGAVIGALFAPGISRHLVGGQNQQDLVAVVLLVLLAIIGQFAASAIGTALRSHISWRPAAFLDSVGGAAVSVLSVLLIAWVIGSVLVASPFSGVVSQVNDSAVLRTVDRLMPSTARTMFSDFRRLLASGPFPEVFSGIGAAHALSVAPGDPAVLNSAGYQDARNRVFKIKGTAPSCSRVIEGSGFVYAPHHIITNAHVVAGVTQGLTVFSDDNKAYPAAVVFYDPQVDIAVLYVPDLNVAPLSFAGQAQVGANAVVAGYPLDHGFTPVPARVGGIQDATGPDIYQTSQVTRQIYEIKANVEPGNSGGPLIAANGNVYGVVFAAAVGVADTGFVLTAAEVAADAHAGRASTVQVSTEGCD
ncbi:MAG TPA: MarP family serine protease [Streptosporangiaceae bacterium]|nr:MarP family serine protease [Streptosporangiaceae bacterium]